MKWRNGKVLEISGGWDGVQTLTVKIVAGVGTIDTLSPGCQISALSYPQLVGEVKAGDLVRLEVSALARELGTGGYAMVAAIIDRIPPDSPTAPGHIVKARYTPIQNMVLGVDEQESPHHPAMAKADSLGGMPVVATDLHSSLPAILAGIYLENPALKVCWIMTDGAALPQWFSHTADSLRRADWLAGTITAGQAFGGDLESASVYSALLAARLVMNVDIAIVGQGPGNLGTGTTWGFSGLDVAQALHAAHVLQGKPVACVRASGADQRPEHRGVSHHTRTTLHKATLIPVDIVLPQLNSENTLDTRAGGPAEAADLVAQVNSWAGKHQVVSVPTEGLAEALEECPVPLKTMGRDLADDPLAFLAAGAAGIWAARLV